MTHSERSDIDLGWRVVLETRDPNGATYPTVYTYVSGETREEVIDWALEHLTGLQAGQRPLMDGWSVVAAWAVPETFVGETVRIEPINQPAWRRAEQ